MRQGLVLRVHPLLPLVDSVAYLFVRRVKVDDNLVSISINEYTLIKDVAEILEIFAILKEIAPEENDEPYLDANFCDAENYRGMPANLSRQSDFMEQ